MKTYEKRILCKFTLREEERTRFGKKKKEKMEKKEEKKGKKKKKRLIVAISGLVEMKGYLKTYNHVKYFFVIPWPFWNETAVYAKFLGGF